METKTNIQEIWLSQPQKNTEYEFSDMMKIMTKLSEYQKKQNRKNSIKIVFLALILMSFSLFFLLNITSSAFNIAGITGVVISTIIFMQYYMKKQFNLSKLDFTLRPDLFTQSVKEKLQARLQIFKWPFRIFILTLVISINLLYLDILSDSEILTRWVFHAGASVFIVLVATTALQIRSKKFKKETLPLIQELQE